MLIKNFLAPNHVEGLFKVLVSLMLMVTNVAQVLAIDCESLLVVRVDLAQHCPEAVYFLTCFINTFPKVVEYV